MCNLEEGERERKKRAPLCHRSAHVQVPTAVGQHSWGKILLKFRQCWESVGSAAWQSCHWLSSSKPHFSQEKNVLWDNEIHKTNSNARQLSGRHVISIVRGLLNDASAPYGSKLSMSRWTQTQGAERICTLWVKAINESLNTNSGCSSALLKNLNLRCDFHLKDRNLNHWMALNLAK